MRAYELIRKKREGEALSPGEIRWLVDGFTVGRLPDSQMAAFLMAVYFRGLNEVETSTLTEALVATGTLLEWPEAIAPVDKHSTGGVGDKATLVVVPLVAACGVPVAKMSGRALGHTGGTIDKLAVFEGLRVDFSAAELQELVQRTGCAIVAATRDLAPGDKKLYALRDVTATVDSVPLIAASVMSKKLAAGARSLVLDVKVGRGAFARTPQAAQALAEAMVAIGERAGRRTVAYGTAMDQPLGRAVGNVLEVQEAIAALSGEGPEDLMQLCLALAAEMLLVGGAASDHQTALHLLRRRLADGSARERLARLIESQGGDPRPIEAPRELPTAPCAAPVRAEREGWVAAVDALEIGLAVGRLGAARQLPEDPVDLRVGLVLERKVGERVEAGAPLATVHAACESDLAEACRQVAAAFTVRPEPAEKPPVLLFRAADLPVRVQPAGSFAPGSENGGLV